MTRKAIYRGKFYPSDKEDLIKMFSDFEEKIKIQNAPEKPFAVIAPHAGYIYSGNSAMFSYKALEKYNFDTAFVIGRSHRYSFPHAAIDDFASVETPLGECIFDSELMDYIASYDIFKKDSKMHDGEHSLEVQMPFIKYINKKASVVSILLGDENTDISKEITETIKKFKNKKIVIICSTDLSHYHRYAEAKKLDGEFADLLAKFDIKGLSVLMNKKEDCRACAMTAVINTMKVAKLSASDNIEILNACNSGDNSGDKSRVVGYLSAVIW